MGPKGNGSEVAETVGGGVARERRKRTPREMRRVEEERNRDRRILREYAEEMRVGLEFSAVEE